MLHRVCSTAQITRGEKMIVKTFILLPNMLFSGSVQEYQGWIAEVNTAEKLQEEEKNIVTFLDW